ncbi:MAG: hypothetical protein A2049_01790 [Elusimicrobia bacterium GWA2_62_23]|nr:MAG: hypothetical protein A2049_01790 [Elusimicrobia bacterium GWA2_62_23]
MHFNLKTDAAGNTDVFFCFELTGAAPEESGRSVAEAVRHMARFVSSLCVPELDAAFELVVQSRLEGEPGPTLALRIRVSHHCGAAALAKAQETARAVTVGLALWERLRWLPADERRYGTLFKNFYPAEIREIGRSTELFEVETGPVSPGGVRYGFCVYPFLPQPDPLSRVLRILNGLPTRIRLSIALAPVRFLSRELSFLRNQREAFSAALSGEELVDNPQMKAAMATVLRMERMGEMPFAMRICAASLSPLAGVSAKSLACALAAPALPEACAGGFDMRLVEDEEEKKVALQNLDRVRFCLPPFLAGVPWGRLPALVSPEEAAGFFRFPAVPGPGMATVRRAVPFSGLPEATGSRIGFAAGVAEGAVEIRLSQESRSRHLCCVGQTGVGKSSFLLSLIAQDMSAGHPLCLLDPHGDLYHRALAAVPPWRRKDVIALDCSKNEPGFSFNLLEHSREREIYKIVESFLEIFNQLFDRNTMGPIFEMAFRCSLHLVMCDPEGATLADFMRFYYDRDYRRQCISRCKDPVISGSWEKIVATAGGELSLNNLSPYIVSKLSSFIFNRKIRKIVSCRQSTVDFNEIIRGKILLVNLAKNSMGNLTASFLGMLFIQKLLWAAMDPRNAKRRGGNFCLYVDEFHALATPSAAEILGEARKFGLSAVVATQVLSSLSPGMLLSLLGNAGNLLAMRLGPADAVLLAPYFAPEFSPAELVSLGVGTAAASILSAGGNKPGPFLLSTANGLAEYPAVPGTKAESASPASTPLPRQAPRRRRARREPASDEGLKKNGL